VTNASNTAEGAPVSGSNDIFLRDGVRDYRAHIVSVSAITRF